MKSYEDVFREKYAEEQRKVYLELFGISEKKEHKLPKNYKEYLKVGIDRISLDIKYNDLKESTRDLRSIRIKGEFFNFFKTGKFREEFYCKLDLNLPKNLFGNNINNVRDGKLIRKSVSKALSELKDAGIVISLNSTVEYIEINKYIVLDEHIFKMNQMFYILRKYITKGNFVREDKHFYRSKNKTGATFGTINKSITFYSKILEILKNEILDKISFVELRKIVSEFKEFMRFEIKLKGKSLNNTLSRDLTLRELLETPEFIIDEIFEKIVSESGFTENNLEITLDKSVKRLSKVLKRYKRVYDRLFVKNFVKDYSSEIWGNDQLKMIADNSTDNKTEKFYRNKSLVNNFKTVKTNEIDSLKQIKKVIKDLNFFRI